MPQTGRILVVDDEADACETLAELLREEGYLVETAADGLKALAKLDAFAPDVVITDLKMPGLDGMGLMHKVHEEDRDRGVIVMTASNAVDTAVAAMRAGAADYLVKPFHFDELALVTQRTLERRRLKQEASHLRQRLNERHRIPSIIGASPAMQAVFDVVLQVAPSRASVLITGESGTGKELVAAALHEHSPRAHAPFIKLHCAALAETLLESELFGHERGAFTGAVARRDGRFQQADGGTLFLDEIGEISPAIQVKLLRFLQEHEFERVGSNHTIKVSVRIVTATSRDLLQRVKQGLFREDLYYRLNVVAIDVPPLRERSTDIGLLAQHFLIRYAKENNKPFTTFSEGAMQRLVHYSWPGNVRELENAIERAVVVCRGDQIRTEDLAATLVVPKAEVRQASDGYPPVPGSSLAAVERFTILKTLEYTGGSAPRAAEILGTSLRNIQYKLQAYKKASPSHRKARKDGGN